MKSEQKNIGVQKFEKEVRILRITETDWMSGLLIIKTDVITMEEKSFDNMLRGSSNNSPWDISMDMGYIEFQITGIL